MNVADNLAGLNGHGCCNGDKWPLLVGTKDLGHAHPTIKKWGSVDDHESRNSRRVRGYRTLFNPK